MTILSLIVFLMGISQALTFEKFGEVLDKIHFGLTFLVTAVVAVGNNEVNNKRALSCDAKALRGLVPGSSCPTYHAVAITPTPTLGGSLSEFIKVLPFLAAGLAIGFAIRFSWNKLNPKHKIED